MVDSKFNYIYHVSMTRIFSQCIFRAIPYSSHSGMGRILIMTNSSLATLSSLEDCLTSSVKSYLAFKIAHVLIGALIRGRVVEFLWIPSHVDIIGNEVANGVAKFARDLHYCVHFGLPYNDLLGPVGSDSEAWPGFL